MQKATASAVSGDSIAVSVVAFGNDPIALLLPKGSTVATALAQADITRGASDVFVSGQDAEDADVLEGGDVLSIVSAKQAG
jgi:hypothetical protein